MFKHKWILIGLALVAVLVLSTVLAAPALAGKKGGGGGGKGGGSKPVFLLIDSDVIDKSIESIVAICPGDPAVCINEDIADPGVRDILFTRPTDITPYSGLVLPTGVHEDEGLFRFYLPDPQLNLNNSDEFTTVEFTTYEFITATGAAADETNLDSVSMVVPLDAEYIAGLVGYTVCAVVFDDDILINADPLYGNLKGATLGLTAFEVTAVGATTVTDTGVLVLQPITVDLVPSTNVEKVCGSVTKGKYGPKKNAK